MAHLVHGNGAHELHIDSDVVARHNHLGVPCEVDVSPLWHKCRGAAYHRSVPFEVDAPLSRTGIPKAAFHDQQH